MRGGQEVKLRHGPREPSCQLGFQPCAVGPLGSWEHGEGASPAAFWKCIWKEARPEPEHQDDLEVHLVKGNDQGHGGEETSQRGRFLTEPAWQL